jgi:ribosomal protein L17
VAHKIDGRKLGRKTGPRLALFKSLTVAVLRYEQVRTTEARAKEIRGRVERMITLAKEGSLSARRRVVAEMPDEPLVSKLRRSRRSMPIAIRTPDRAHRTAERRRPDRQIELI